MRSLAQIQLVVREHLLLPTIRGNTREPTCSKAVPEMDLPEPTKIAQHPIVASLLGAVVGLRFVPGQSLLSRSWNALGGFSIALYCGPIACEVMALKSVQSQAAMGFALGLFGLTLAAALVDGVRATQLGEIITSWLGRK